MSLKKTVIYFYYFRISLKRKRDLATLFLGVISIVIVFAIQKINNTSNSAKISQNKELDLKDEIEASEVSYKKSRAVFIYMDRSSPVIGNSDLNRLIPRLYKGSNANIKKLDFSNALILSCFMLIKNRPRVDLSKIDFSISFFYESVKGNVCQINGLENLENFYGEKGDFFELSQCLSSQNFRGENKTNLLAPVTDFRNKFLPDSSFIYSLENYSHIDLVIISDFDDDSPISEIQDVKDRLAALKIPMATTRLSLVKLPVRQSRSRETLDEQLRRVERTIDEFKTGLQKNKSFEYNFVDWTLLYGFKDITSTFANDVIGQDLQEKRVDLFYSDDNKSSKISFQNKGDSLEILQIRVRKQAEDGNVWLKVRKGRIGSDKEEAFRIKADKNSQYVKLEPIQKGEFYEISVDEGSRLLSKREDLLVELVSTNSLIKKRYRVSINKIPKGKYYLLEDYLILLSIIVLVFVVLVSSVKRLTPYPIDLILDIVREKDSKKRLSKLKEVQRYVRQNKSQMSKPERITSYLLYLKEHTRTDGERRLVQNLINSV